MKPSDKGVPGASTRETLSNPRVTGPQERSQTFRAHRPADLETIRVGDFVDITYSEALALAIRLDVKR